MKRRNLSGYSLGLCTVVAMFSGCGGSEPPIGAPGAQSLMVANHARRDRSWMLPEAKSKNLLYVSTYDDNEVYVFSYPKGAPMGTLSGFTHVGGLCTDTAGNIWIGDYDKVLEYAHGGTQPIATLDNPMPSSLIGSFSVDPMTGNLAISNPPFGSDYGNVGVYKQAKGSPTYRQIDQPQQCSYDENRNLYCDTYALESSGFGLYKLPAGKTRFVKVNLNASILVPGGVQWDGQNLAVGDAKQNVVLRFRMRGRRGGYVGSMHLEGADWVNEFSIAKSRIAGANQVSKSVMIWPYPQGGKPTTKLHHIHAIGVTVSLALPH